MFSFLLESKNIWSPLLFLQWPTCHLTRYCSVSMYLNVFHSFTCCWVLVLVHCDIIVYRELFHLSYICVLKYALDAKYDLFWEKLHGLLKKISTVNEILCRCLISPLDLWCHLILRFLCWFFFWMPYLFVMVGYWSLTLSLCLMKLSRVTLGMHKLTIVTSSWCVVLFIVFWPSLSPLTNLGLESIRNKFCYSCLFLGPFAWKNLSPTLLSSYANFFFFLVSEMSFL
jgi:hypothetical protein